jgi:transcriptional regulator of nitric oxide reductase
MESEASAPGEATPAVAGRAWRRSLLALVRAGLLALLVWLIGVNARQAGEATGAEDLEPADAAAWFPAAASLGEVGEDGGRGVLDEGGEVLGRVFTTRPASDAIRGYSGPTHLLVACGPDGTCLGVRILATGDTASHRHMVEEDGEFLKRWNGLAVSEFPRPDAVDVVSGASLTSDAIARSMRARFSGEDLAAPFPREFPEEAVGEVFPAMSSWRVIDGRRESFEMLDADGGRVGVVLRSGNRADAVRGFNGAQDLLVCLDAAASGSSGC